MEAAGEDFSLSRALGPDRAASLQPIQGFSYEGETFHLRLGGAGVAAWADVGTSAGRSPLVRLSLLCSVERDATRDETGSLAAAPATGQPAGALDRACVTLEFERVSTAWQSASVRIECAPRYVVVTHRARGRGRLGRACLLGGESVAPGASGPIYSGCELPSLFSPGPEDPRKVTRSAAENAVIGVSGDSLAGRGHWFFTPGPLCYALGKPGGPWVVVGLLAPVQEMHFPELAYRAADRGFRLELDYEGHTEVDGTYDLPAVAVIPGVEDPYDGIGLYRELLRSRYPGPAQRAPAARRPRWWSEPMFCGWGAQSHLAKLRGTSPQQQCTQANYDAFLADLGAQGVEPGTVVVDDGWQSAYALAAPHPQRWPALGPWIRQRHEEGRRVLLWWKAWSYEGAPPESHITNPAGRALAAAPIGAGAKAWLQETVRAMLAPDGLGADGLKVDFTAATPRGWHLRPSPAPWWGISLLYEYLQQIYRAAKQARPDALVITQAAHPGFCAVTDMVRLNDMLRLDEQEPWAPVVEQMSYRAAVVRAACPEALIDTDDWCAPDLAQWREYLSVKAELGVPALYYTTHLDRTGEQLADSDYEQLRRVWAQARSRAGAGTVPEAP